MSRTNNGWLVKAVFTTIIANYSFSARAQEDSITVLREWLYYNNTGWQAYNRGNDERAAQAFRQAIETLRPHYKTHQDMIARSSVDYARVLCRQSRYNEAEPLVKWALTVREKSPGPNSKALCETLEMLAKIDRGGGRNADAELVLKRLAEVQVKVLGHDHSDLIPTYEALADVYTAQGKLTEAEPAFKRSLSLREANAVENAKRAEKLENAAELLRLMATDPGGTRAGRFENEAKTLRESTSDSLGAADTTTNYASMLRKAGRSNEAEDLEARAKAIRDAVETRASRARRSR